MSNGGAVDVLIRYGPLPMESLRRIAGSFWGRALVSFGLLALVVSRIDLGSGTSRLSHGRWSWFVAGVAVLFASFLVASRRWFLFLQAAGVGTLLSDAVRVYLIGTFTTNFLPTQLGGDVTRAWLAGRPGARIRAATTVVVDRATALGCLIVVAWLAFAFDRASVPGVLTAALAAASGGLALAGLAAALIVGAAAGLGQRLPPRLSGSMPEVRRAAAPCLRGSVLRKTVIFGLLFQALVTLSVWLVARSIALDVPFSVIAVTLPVVLVFAATPISIGGLGIREGSYVLLLGQAGVGATEATLLSLMSGAAFAIASLPGGVALLQPWMRRLPLVGSESSSGPIIKGSRR